jgi:hypothetical protein
MKCERVPLRWKRIFAVYLYARGGELEALEWSAVNFDQRFVHIYQSIDAETGDVKRTKTATSRPIVASLASSPNFTMTSPLATTSRTLSTSETHARATRNNAAHRGVSSCSLSRRTTTSSSNARSEVSTTSLRVLRKTGRRPTLRAKKWRSRMQVGNKRGPLSPWPAPRSKDSRMVGTHRSRAARARRSTPRLQHNRRRLRRPARRTDAPATTRAGPVSLASKINSKRQVPAQRR